MSITSLFSRMRSTVTEALDSVVNPDYKAADQELKRIEKFLNKGGWIPGVSIATGAVRESLGYLEVVIGLTLACFHQVVARTTKDEKTREKFYKYAEVDFSYCLNGAGNIFRGKLEQAALWAIPALVYSKLVLIDMSSKRAERSNCSVTSHLKEKSKCRFYMICPIEATFRSGFFIELQN